MKKQQAKSKELLNKSRMPIQATIVEYSKIISEAFLQSFLQRKSMAKKKHNKYVNSLMQEKKFNEVELICRNKLKRGEANHEIYSQLASACGMQKNYEEMLKYCQHALKIKYDNPKVHNNMGYALQKVDRVDYAIVAYKKALEFQQDYVNAYINISIALLEKNSFSEAIYYCKKAIEIDPRQAKIYNNLGSAQLALGDSEAAISSYTKALEIEDSREFFVNLAMAQLISKDYVNGWRNYEKRIDSNGEILCTGKIPNCAPFNMQKVTDIGTLLIVSEQGLGDTLQFMRFIYNIKDKGLRFHFCAPTKLHHLIKESGIDPSPLPPEVGAGVSSGQWISLMSIPQYLEANPSSNPTKYPYLKTPEKLVEKWRCRIISKNPEKKLLIGINWAGNRADNKKSGRNIPPELIMPIINECNATFISIQRGISGQRSQISWPDYQKLLKEQYSIHRLADSDESEDFLEYAAVICCCDLIITTATTTAHLAAGLGKPTWVMLEKVPDWRWGLQGASTFWYPSAKLYRQQEQGNWEHVTRSVRKELIEFINNHPLNSQNHNIC